MKPGLAWNTPEQPVPLLQAVSLSGPKTPRAEGTGRGNARPQNARFFGAASFGCSGRAPAAGGRTEGPSAGADNAQRIFFLP